MQIAFNDKICFITGASSLIGIGVMKKLVEAGASVLATGRSEVDIFQRLLIANGFATQELSNVEYYQADLTNEVSTMDLFKKIKTKYGYIDFAFNNAGLPFKKQFKDMSLNEWNQIIDTNLTTTFLSLKGEIELISEKGASIVNMASISSLRSNSKGISAYAAAKHGVIGLTKSVALEFASKKVRVNAILPGIMNSHERQKMDSKVLFEYANKHPLGRIARAEDIANLVLFLFSDLSQYITGASIPVDGGISAK